MVLHAHSAGRKYYIEAESPEQADELSYDGRMPDDEYEVETFTVEIEDEEGNYVG
jgi:hypothetical protein